jgi:hypothetical protein
MIFVLNCEFGRALCVFLMITLTLRQIYSVAPSLDESVVTLVPLHVAGTFQNSTGSTGAHLSSDLPSDINCVFELKSLAVWADRAMVAMID